MCELEASKTPSDVLAAPVRETPGKAALPMNHPEHRDPAAPNWEGAYPSLRLAGFSDVNFAATDRPGNTSRFSKGQYILHMSSALSPRVNFFGVESDGPFRRGHWIPPAIAQYVSMVVVRPERWRTLAIAAGCSLVLLLLWINRPAGSPFSRIADPPGILREIRQLRELVTIRYSIQKVAGLTENKIPLGSESILLIVQARVHAGIDLSELRDQDIRVTRDGHVEIKLPRAKILHTDLDEKNTRVWDRSKTWWTPWVPYDMDLEKKARIAALSSVEKEAVDMGILLDAQVSAQNAIRALLRPLGFQEVTFRANQS